MANGSEGTTGATRGAAEGAGTVRSMTGFARARRSTTTAELDVEIRSVNHRFLEVTVKTPRILNVAERDIKAVLQKLHRRGRIDVSVTRRAVAAAEAASPVDEKTLDAAVSAYARACRRYGVQGDYLAPFIAQIMSRDAGRVEEPTDVDDAELAALLEAVEEASKLLAAMREREGEWLVKDISGRLSALEGVRRSIAGLAVNPSARFKQRLEDRLKTLTPELQIDPQRLALEVALLAERCDISEELARLDSHFDQFKTSLKGDPEGVGRKLDFLIQEFGREFNTITSKAQDAGIQTLVVNAKAELEKIREQVQNVE